MGDPGDGHADWAKSVGLAVGGMVLLLAVVRCGDRDRNQATPGFRPVKRVNVSESQCKIDGQRDEREP